MEFGEIVIGQRQRWVLKKKLGEGDAGEVHLVESLLDRKPAILKRPYSNGTASQVLRQATQLLREAQILKSLATMTFPEAELLALEHGGVIGGLAEPLEGLIPWKGNKNYRSKNYIDITSPAKKL